MNKGLRTISIIIPTFNRAKILDITLESCVNQSYPKDLFEIMDYIKEEILLKILKERLYTLNPLSTDTFKTKYEHIDLNKIKITFYWV